MNTGDKARLWGGNRTIRCILRLKTAIETGREALPNSCPSPLFDNTQISRWQPKCKLNFNLGSAMLTVTRKHKVVGDHESRSLTKKSASMRMLQVATHQSLSIKWLSAARQTLAVWAMLYPPSSPADASSRQSTVPPPDTSREENRKKW